MSFDTNWNIEKYREDRESEEHWQLRKTFMSKWKKQYPEDRLVCLAQVFANVEVMSCRYPEEVMKEVATLSKDIAQSYRAQKRMRLQRTFVAASDAARERARGVKRAGDAIEAGPAPKSRINFVREGESVPQDAVDLPQDAADLPQDDDEVVDPNIEEIEAEAALKDEAATRSADYNLYLDELLREPSLHVSRFQKSMFNTFYGKFVLLIRPWTSKLGNIQASCQACHVTLESKYDNNVYTILVNGNVLGSGRGPSKQAAKEGAEWYAWENVKKAVISVLIKEQFIAQGDARIGVDEVAGRQAAEETFGSPIDSSIAYKMMQIMGWKGGGLGADSQGIAEPIKPNLQMVNRAGLGSTSSDISTLRRLSWSLMQRYQASSSLDVDLVFSAEFNKEERAALHQQAQRLSLTSRSYGSGNERFLVVKKKLDPFGLVEAVVKEGGNTAKYHVFIPVSLEISTTTYKD